MIRSLDPLHRLFSSAAFVGMLCVVAHAQPPDCDSLHTATFTHQDMGGYLYSFDPVPSSGLTLLTTDWAFLSQDFTHFSLYAQPQVEFPSEGDYLVCLRSVVLDDQLAYCTSIHCELVDVPVDSACAQLQPSFTITAASGTITFIDQTVSDDPIISELWDFGDGMTSIGASSTHEFPSSGPYQVCLVVSTANCTATACNWIYLGPADVPCDTLLHAAIGVIQYERTIAVFDQSITSGMNSSIQWVFGDGETASGSPVIHTYAQDGSYDVCGTVDLWGPLAADTCMAMACQWVSTVQGSAGLGEEPTAPVLHAHPVPFANELTVDQAVGGAQWELIDMLGRVRLYGTVATTGPLVIDGRGIGAGTYFVRTRSSMGIMTIGVIKE